MYSTSFALVALSLLSAACASISTIYWPVTYPSATYPWILGEKNLLFWQTGGGSGIDSFDIQLHNNNKTILNGFIPIALRVPLERLPTGRKNFGGEMEVDLDPNVMPTGDGFRLIFMNTFHGQVYSVSPAFSILASKPANFTDAPLPTATVTATLTELPNPTQEWAKTLNGIDPDATRAPTVQPGNAGSGTS